MAALKTSLGCITEEFNVPINIVSSFITIFLVFKIKQLNALELNLSF